MMKRQKPHALKKAPSGLLFPAFLLLVMLCACTPVSSAPPSAVTDRVLPADDPYAPVVSCVQGEADGPVIYVIGGTHGDEVAGWTAANTLLARAREQTLGLKRGTLYILPEANKYGVANEQRKTKDDYDLNRAFPGNPEGKDAARIAYAIFEDIKEKQPALVIDLHEAKLHTDGKDNLGNTIIAADITPVSDLVLSLLADSEAGVLPLSAPLSLYGSPPAGSLNKTVSGELQIPVITIETSREEALSVRIENQLVIVGRILDAYGMR